MKRPKRAKRSRPEIEKAEWMQIMRPVIRTFVTDGLWHILHDPDCRPCLVKLCSHEDVNQCIEHLAVAMCEDDPTKPATDVAPCGVTLVKAPSSDDGQ